MKKKFEIDEVKPKTHDRILSELKKGRSTPKQLAKDLGLSDDAVQCQLRKMVARNEVTKDGWGLYALATGIVKVAVQD